MKITTKLAVEYLKKNKRRSAVTLITIIIVSILITAVFSLVSSFRQYMVNIERNNKNWEAEFIDIRYSDALEIAKYDNVKETSLYYDYGYSKEDACKYDRVEKRFDENQVSYFPEPFYMRAYDDNALKNANFKIESGRLPENSNEIILTTFQPIYYDEDNNRILFFNVGDEIELTFGEEKKTYKVVGIVSDLEEGSRTFGETRLGVVTYLDKDTISDSTIVNVRILTNNVKEIKKTTEMIEEDLKLSELPNREKVIQKENSFVESFKQMIEAEMGKEINNKEEIDSNAKVVYNIDLLSYELVTDINSTFATALFCIGGGFTLIIVFVSITVIYTSFKMTYNDRIRTLGVLSSIRNE